MIQNGPMTKASPTTKMPNHPKNLVSLNALIIHRAVYTKT